MRGGRPFKPHSNQACLRGHPTSCERPVKPWESDRGVHAEIACSKPSRLWGHLGMVSEEGRAPFTCGPAFRKVSPVWRQCCCSPPNLKTPCQSQCRVEQRLIRERSKWHGELIVSRLASNRLLTKTVSKNLLSICDAYCQYY